MKTAHIRGRMTPITPEEIAGKLILRGIHLDLTEAMRETIHGKVGKLLRHESRIQRIRVDVEHDKVHNGKQQFIAKGHIEISGPDMVASVIDANAYAAVNLLIDKLDGLLRKRHSEQKEKVHHPHGVDLPVALPKV